MIFTQIPCKARFDLEFYRAHGQHFEEVYASALGLIDKIIANIQRAVPLTVPVMGPAGVMAGYMLAQDRRFEVVWRDSPTSFEVKINVPEVLGQLRKLAP